MTASALREVYFMESGSPSSQTALVEPQSTQQSVSAENEADQELATARRLFDLFQTAREKRAARFAPSAQNLAPRNSPLQLRRRLLIGAAALLVVGLSAWGLSRRSTQSPPDAVLGASAPTAETAPSVAAVQAAAAVPVVPPSGQRQTSTLASRPKPTVRNSWKPGKTLAKAVPPPSSARDRRDERDYDRRDDRRDDRDDDRRADQWDDRDMDLDSDRDPLLDREASKRRIKKRRRDADRLAVDAEDELLGEGDGGSSTLNPMANDTVGGATDPSSAAPPAPAESQ